MNGVRFVWFLFLKQRVVSRDAHTNIKVRTNTISSHFGDYVTPTAPWRFGRVPGPVCTPLARSSARFGRGTPRPHLLDDRRTVFLFSRTTVRQASRPRLSQFDQFGFQFCPAEVSCLGLVPSASIVQICLVPARVDWNTRRRPSADHVGDSFRPAS